LPWQPILGAKSAKFGDTLSFLGLAFHNAWQDGKADGRVNSAEVLSTSYKNLMNFDPPTPELTVMVWRPFMRQMREIVETRSTLQTRIRQRIGTAERICAKFTRKTVWSFARMSLNAKVKGQKSRSPGTKNALCTHNTPSVWTEWNALVAYNVTRASSRRTDSIAAEGCLRRDACAGPGGLPLGSATHF